MTKGAILGLIVAVAFAWTFGVWALAWVFVIHYGIKQLDRI